MDNTDERILDIMKGNARISFQELGDELGISRVAAMKRVRKLEEEGVIRQYNTCIYREDEFTMFVDLEIKPDRYDKVLKYITTRTTFIRQIFLSDTDIIGRFTVKRLIRRNRDSFSVVYDCVFASCSFAAKQSSLPDPVSHVFTGSAVQTG